MIADGLRFLVTWAGPALSLVMLVPIAWRPIVDRGVTGLSAAGTIATAVTVQLWLTYGVLVADPRQIGVNVAVVIVRFAIMAAAVWACRQAALRVMAIGAVLGALALATVGAPAVGLAATVMSTINRCPQAAHTVRRGRGAGLSVAGFGLGFLADVSWMTYGLVYGDRFVFLSSVICAAFDALIVVAATRPDQALIVRLRALLTPTAEPVPDPLPTFGVVAGE